MALPRLRSFRPSRPAAIMLVVAALAVFGQVAWASSSSSSNSKTADHLSVANLSLDELDEQLQVCSPPLRVSSDPDKDLTIMSQKN